MIYNLSKNFAIFVANAFFSDSVFVIYLFCYLYIVLSKKTPTFTFTTILSISKNNNIIDLRISNK